MNASVRIRDARNALLLSEQDVAARASLTVYELGDIEARSDEFATGISIRSAFSLCLVLGLSIYELLDLDEIGPPVHVPPGKYVQAIRRMGGLTSLQLDEKIGYEAGFIDRVEAGDLDLLEYPAELAMEIAQNTRSATFQLVNVLEQSFSGAL